MRNINKIVVHCSDTPKGKFFDINNIRRWHVQERGWSDVGYHYVILLDGTIQIGRDLKTKGAHVKGHNSTSIGICYIGGAKGEDTRTLQQKVSLIHLIATLKRTFRDAEVVGHRDLSKDLNKDGKITKEEWSKFCPSFDAILNYKNI